MCGVFRGVSQQGRAGSVPMFPCFPQEVSSTSLFNYHTADSISVNMKTVFQSNCQLKQTKTRFICLAFSEIGNAANCIDSYIMFAVETMWNSTFFVSAYPLSVAP